MNQPALRDLIEERKRATGRSYDEIARLGRVISGSAVHRMATQDIHRIPNPETVKALARGLGVDPEAVLRAAGKSVGIVSEVINVPTDDNSRAIVAGLGEMSEEERAAVARMVEGLRRASGRNHEG